MLTDPRQASQPSPRKIIEDKAIPGASIALRGKPATAAVKLARGNPGSPGHKRSRARRHYRPGWGAQGWWKNRHGEHNSTAPRKWFDRPKSARQRREHAWTRDLTKPECQNWTVGTSGDSITSNWYSYRRQQECRNALTTATSWRKIPLACRRQTIAITARPTKAG